MLPPCISPTPHRLNEYAVAPLSFVLNACLILLIILRSPKELRVYSRVLLANCLADLGFTTACFVVEFHVSIRDGRFMGMFNGFFAGSSPFTTLVLVSLWATALYSFVLIVSAPFLYRYLLICRGHHMGYKMYFALIAALIALSSLIPLALWVSYWPTEEYAGTTCHDPGQIVLFNAEGGVTLLNVLPILVAAVLLTGNYAVIVFCIWRTRRQLQQNRTTSPKTREMNRQLTQILLVQAMLPLVVVVAPLMACFVIIVSACSRCSFFLEETTTILAWVPLLNPACTMLVITPYRRALVRIVTEFRIAHLVSPSSTTPVNNGRDLTLNSRQNTATQKQRAQSFVSEIKPIVYDAFVAP